MVLDLIRDQGGFREVRNEYGSRIGGGNEGLDVSMRTCWAICYMFFPFIYTLWQNSFLFEAEFWAA